MRPEWRKINLACALEGDKITITRLPTPPMRPDLLALFDVGELKKYMTEDELAAIPAPARATTAAASPDAATEETH